MGNYRNQPLVSDTTGARHSPCYVLLPHRLLREERLADEALHQPADLDASPPKRIHELPYDCRQSRVFRLEFYGRTFQTVASGCCFFARPSERALDVVR